MPISSNYSLEYKFSDLAGVISTIGETLEDQLSEDVQTTPEIKAEMLGFLGGLTVYFNAISECSDPDRLDKTLNILQNALPESESDKAKPIMDNDMLFDYLLITISDGVKKQIEASMDNIVLGGQIEFGLTESNSIPLIKKGALTTFPNWSRNLTVEKLKEMRQSPVQFTPQFTGRILN